MMETAITTDYTLAEKKLIKSALCCMEKRAKRYGLQFDNINAIYDYLKLFLATETNEVFGVLFLTNTHQLIAAEKLFFGTINTTMVYSRVVVKRALLHEAAAVVFVHNHPSGIVEPSGADIKMTSDLQDILDVIDVRVLDHMIVGTDKVFSFAQKGLL